MPFQLGVMDVAESVERVHEIPFSSETKWMAVKVRPRSVAVSEVCYYFDGEINSYLCYWITH